MPSSERKEYIFNIICPKKIDTETTALFITLKSVNTIWLDDVSIKVLPAKDGGKSMNGNLIKNGSFEVGRTHWYGRYREHGGYAFSDIAAENIAQSEVGGIAKKGGADCADKFRQGGDKAEQNDTDKSPAQPGHLGQLICGFG